MNPNSISVESGINMGSRNYIISRNSYQKMSSMPMRITCGARDVVANRKTYFDISCEHHPVRLSTLDKNFFAQKKCSKGTSLNSRPPWNFSTHVGNREYVFPTILNFERLKSISRGSNNATLCLNPHLAGLPSFARDSLWAFSLLELPQPIRSRCLGYTTAGNVMIGDGSEFYCRPPAGLPNQKSNNTVAKCLNWDFTDV